MSQQHANIWSYPSHSPVDPYTSPWSQKGHGHSHEWLTPIPFVQCQLALPFLRYSYFKIWPWESMVKAMCVVNGQSHIWPGKFEVKVMNKVKPTVHIWGLDSNWYVCFSFHGNRTISGWDIANSIFDLEKRSRSCPRSNLMVQIET